MGCHDIRALHAVHVQVVKLNLSLHKCRETYSSLCFKSNLSQSLNHALYDSVPKVIVGSLVLIMFLLKTTSYLQPDFILATRSFFLFINISSCCQSLFYSCHVLLLCAYLNSEILCQALSVLIATDPNILCSPSTLQFLIVPLKQYQFPPPLFLVNLFPKPSVHNTFTSNSFVTALHFRQDI
jgi:hypothetical protein